MIAGHDLAIGNLVWIDFPQEYRVASAVAGPSHSKLLVKIAIVNFAAPTNADRVAAHEPINRRGIKRADQEVHVLLEFIVMPEIAREAADRKICNRVEFIKHNAKLVFQFAFEIELQFSL